MTRTLQTRWMEMLGYAGLIPFLGLGGLSAYFQGTDLAAMFSQYIFIYALCIVSFLGAVHWGVALVQAKLPELSASAGVSPAEFETRGFVWGVTPSLLAWLVGAFSPSDWTLYLLAVTLVLVWLADRRLLKKLKGFEDYMRLRNHLTLGASVGLLAAARFA